MCSSDLDDDSGRLMLKHFLRLRKDEAMAVRTGSDAVEVCARDRFDAILMDIQLPGLDGLEATQRIRAAGPNVHTPIIALTAMAAPGDRVACLDAGATRYLSKPFRLAELSAMLDRILVLRDSKA